MPDGAASEHRIARQTSLLADAEVIRTIAAARTLQHVVNDRFRGRYLLEVDFHRSGLSFYPANHMPVMNKQGDSNSIIANAPQNNPSSNAQRMSQERSAVRGAFLWNLHHDSMYGEFKP
jgi:hypothetical protein